MLQLFTAHGVGQFGGENPGWHGDDRVTGDHHQRRNHLTQRRFRHDVAKPHGGQRHDSPIDAFGNAGETVLRAFDHVHQRTEHRHQRADTDQKHHDFLFAAAQRRHQVIGLLEVRTELEHAENPQHADDANNQQILRIAVIQRENARHDRQQIHQPIKTERIAQRLGRTVETQDVLTEKDDRETPLDVGQHVGVVLVNAVDAVEHHDHQTGEDDQQQNAVEAPSGEGVALENHDVKPFTPVAAAVHE